MKSIKILSLGIVIIASIVFVSRELPKVFVTIPPSTQTATISGAGSGLVAHYEFDEGTETGAIGQAKSFNGTSDYVGISASTVNFNNNYTVSFWLKPLAGFSGTIVRVSNSVSNTVARDKYEFRANGSGVTFITGNGSIADIDIFSTPIPPNTWTLITCVLDGNNAKLCYKNGSLIATASNDVDSSLVSSSVGFIGTNRNSEGNNFYEGSIDDVRIYNRVLNASEI